MSFKPTCPKCGRLCPARAHKCAVCGTRLYLAVQRQKAKKERRVVNTGVTPWGARTRTKADSYATYHDEPTQSAPEHTVTLPRDVLAQLDAVSVWDDDC